MSNKNQTAGEYPPLPQNEHWLKDTYTASQMRAYADADRDMRVQDDSDALTVAYMSGFERGKDAAKAQAAPSQDAEDAARLDWLASKSQVNIQRVHYPDDDRSTFEVTPYDCDSFEGDTLREAIDAARAQQEGK